MKKSDRVGGEMFYEAFKNRLHKNKLKASAKDNTAASEKRIFIDTWELEQELMNNNMMWNIPIPEQLTSHRKIIGKLIVFAKKIVRRLLFWQVNKPLLQQREFNGSVTRSLNGLFDYNRVVMNHMMELTKTNSELNYKILMLEQKLLQNEADEKMRINYLSFENKFRGSETHLLEKIKSAYLSYFRNKETVLDIGCGRGEFLQFLIQQGYEATGVDISEEMADYCILKGLPVVKGDAIAYLRETHEKFDVMISLHVIEHMKPGLVTEMIQHCYNRLNDDGILILETPNPQCLSIFANSFSIDLSHRNPVHPDALIFLLKEVGFKEVEVRHLSMADHHTRLQQSTDDAGENRSYNENIRKLNDLLFSYQDYGVVARK